MDIVAALRARSGVVCTVGAGGKKTTLYELAERTADGASDGRTVVTATVRIPLFDPHVERVVVTDDPVSTVERLPEGSGAASLGMVPERESADRYRGYDPTVVDELAAVDAVDPVLVKADGARTRQFKAPADREPQIPESADTVIPVASARVVGKPLAAEHVHRPERVAAITGRRMGETIRTEDVACVLTDARGGLKGIPDGATVVPLINMVDDESLQAVGEDIARRVLDRIDVVSRVVLSQMTADDPLLAVVE